MSVIRTLTRYTEFLVINSTEFVPDIEHSTGKRLAYTPIIYASYKNMLLSTTCHIYKHVLIIGISVIRTSCIFPTTDDVLITDIYCTK